MLRSFEIKHFYDWVWCLAHKLPLVVFTWSRTREIIKKQYLLRVKKKDQRRYIFFSQWHRRVGRKNITTKREFLKRVHVNVHSLEFHSRNQKLKIIQLNIKKKYKDQGKILIFSLFTSQNLLGFYPQTKMN